MRAILVGGGAFMFKLLMNTSSYSLKKKLTFIYILNALDIVFTFTLLKTGLFYEANGLMIGVVESPLLSILVKLLIPALLIIYLLFKIEELPFDHLKLCTFCVNSVVLVYACINILHMNYTVMYFVQHKV